MSRTWDGPPPGPRTPRLPGLLFQLLARAPKRVTRSEVADVVDLAYYRDLNRQARDDERQTGGAT